MKEYIEREAVIKTIKNHKCESKVVYSIEEALYCVGQEIGKAIGNVPAADVVEVVRCKDCKYWKCYGGQYADDGECWHLGELDCCMHKDDYCSKGKRKMDKEE